MPNTMMMSPSQMVDQVYHLARSIDGGDDFSEGSKEAVECGLQSGRGSRGPVVYNASRAN